MNANYTNIHSVLNILFINGKIDEILEHMKHVDVQLDVDLPFKKLNSDPYKSSILKNFLSFCWKYEVNYLNNSQVNCEEKEIIKNKLEDITYLFISKISVEKFTENTLSSLMNIIILTNSKRSLTYIKDNSLLESEKLQSLFSIKIRNSGNLDIYKTYLNYYNNKNKEPYLVLSLIKNEFSKVTACRMLDFFNWVVENDKNYDFHATSKSGLNLLSAIVMFLPDDNYKDKLITKCLELNIKYDKNFSILNDKTIVSTNLLDLNYEWNKSRFYVTQRSLSLINKHILLNNNCLSSSKSKIKL